MAAKEVELTLAEAVERLKQELSLDPSLKGKAAVEAAKRVLLSRGKLKEQIQLLCNELGIETGWAGDAGGGQLGLRKENARLRAQLAELQAAGSSCGGGG
eukprot:SAG11_NODE_16008_length_559_cov_1.447826_1_plen_99_part_10